MCLVRQTCCNPVHLLPFMHLTTNLRRCWCIYVHQAEYAGLILLLNVSGKAQWKFSSFLIRGSCYGYWIAVNHYRVSFFRILFSVSLLYSEPVAHPMARGFVFKPTVVSSRVEETHRGFIQIHVEIWVQLASQRSKLLPWLSGREGNKYEQQKTLAHTLLSGWSQCSSYSYRMWGV